MRKFLAVLVVSGTACPAFAQDVSGVQQASQRFSSAMSGGDAAAAASLFTDDAVVLPPGRSELTGRADIQRFLGAMTRSVQNLRYTSEDVHPLSDGVAREIGGFSFKGKGQNPQDVTGKYVIVWVKSGGDWKISTDIWNRNANAGGNGAKTPGAGAGGRRNGQGRGDPGTGAAE